MGGRRRVPLRARRAQGVCKADMIRMLDGVRHQLSEARARIGEAERAAADAGARAAATDKRLARVGAELDVDAALHRAVASLLRGGGGGGAPPGGAASALRTLAVLRGAMAAAVAGARAEAADAVAAYAAALAGARAESARLAGLLLLAAAGGDGARSPVSPRRALDLVVVAAAAAPHHRTGAAPPGAGARPRHGAPRPTAVVLLRSPVPQLLVQQTAAQADAAGVEAAAVRLDRSELLPPPPVAASAAEAEAMAADAAARAAVLGARAASLATELAAAERELAIVYDAVGCPEWTRAVGRRWGEGAAGGDGGQPPGAPVVAGAVTALLKHLDALGSAIEGGGSGGGGHVSFADVARRVAAMRAAAGGVLRRLCRRADRVVAAVEAAAGAAAWAGADACGAHGVLQGAAVHLEAPAAAVAAHAAAPPPRVDAAATDARHGAVRGGGAASPPSLEGLWGDAPAGGGAGEGAWGDAPQDSPAQLRALRSPGGARLAAELLARGGGARSRGPPPDGVLQAVEAQHPSPWRASDAVAVAAAALPPLGTPSPQRSVGGTPSPQRAERRSGGAGGWARGR